MDNLLFERTDTGLRFGGLTPTALFQKQPKLFATFKECEDGSLEISETGNLFSIGFPFIKTGTDIIRINTDGKETKYLTYQLLKTNAETSEINTEWAYVGWDHISNAAIFTRKSAVTAGDDTDE